MGIFFAGSIGEANIILNYVDYFKTMAKLAIRERFNTSATSAS